eukprot:441133_1
MSFFPARLLNFTTSIYLLSIIGILFEYQYSWIIGAKKNTYPFLLSFFMLASVLFILISWLTPNKKTTCIKQQTWNGFKTRKIGLEMQKPWALYILSGKKSIETRSYSLPEALLNRKIEILESEKGIDGVSTLNGNIFDAKDLNHKICRKGWVIFDEVIEYKNRLDFEQDVKKHLVSSDSGYAWKDGKTDVIFGWKVNEFCVYDNTSKISDNYGITRRLRSLFEIQSIKQRVQQN